MKNKGFSLVELIIVLAIMAVLIGVLAPTYLKYVDRTKRTKDCTNLGAILDACEVLAADPDVDWSGGSSAAIVILVEEDGVEYSGNGPLSGLTELAKADQFKLDANWGPFEISAYKGDDGHLIFDITNDTQISVLNEYSEALANRLE